MLLQITPIPPPDIGGALARLGAGIAKVLNPQAEQKQAFLDLLAQNPDILSSFAQAQRQAEAQAAKLKPTTEEARAAGDVTQPTPSGERFAPNVLEAFGFSLSEAQSILQAAPVSAEERAGIPEAEARVKLQQLQAAERQAEVLLAGGLPELRAAIILKSATLEEARAEFDTQEFKVFEEAVQRLSPEDKALLDFSKFEPDFAKLKVQLTIAEAQARARAAKDPFKRAQARFNLSKSYDDEITDTIKEAREAESDDEVRLAVQRLNDLARARLADLPGTTFTFLSQEDENFLRRNGINLRVFRAPTLGEVPNRVLQGLQDEGVPLLAAGENAEQYVSRFLGDPTIRPELATRTSPQGRTVGELWTSLTDDDRQLWLDQLAERARLEKAEDGPPLTVAETNELAEKARELIKTPGLSKDIAIILLTLNKVGQAFGLIKRVVGRAIGESLEELKDVRELVKFLSSPEGQAAMRRTQPQGQ